MAAERQEYRTDLIAEFMRQNGLKPMDLVRLCGISVTSTYRVSNERPLYDLNVIHKIYTGLLRAGYQVTWIQLTGIV